MTVNVFAATFLAVFWACPVWAATSGQDLEIIPMSLKVLASLAIVLGLVLFLYAVLKRGHLVPGGKSGQIKIVEIRHLAPKKTLYLVEVKDRTLLIGTTTERMETLAQWPSTGGEPFAEALAASEKKITEEDV